MAKEVSRDTYILLLEDAIEKFQKNKMGYSYEDFSKKCTDLGIHSKNSVLYTEICNLGTSPVPKDPNSNGYSHPYTIRLEAYLSLIEWQELQLTRNYSQEARLEARKAINLAKWALWIAIIVGGLEVLSNLGWLDFISK